MLEHLLRLLQDGGTFRIDDLARALDTSPALVEAMLESLRRMGHLKFAGDTSSELCQGCPLACSCSSGIKARVWTLANTCDSRMRVQIAA